jgi:hypothetical protein
VGGGYTFDNPFTSICSTTAGSTIDVTYCNTTPQLVENGTYLQFCNGLPYSNCGPYSNYYIDALGYIADTCCTYVPVTTLDTNECRFYVSGVACNPACYDYIFDDNCYHANSYGIFMISQYYSDRSKIAFFECLYKCGICNDFQFYDTRGVSKGFSDGVNTFFTVHPINCNISSLNCSHASSPLQTELINCNFLCNKYWIYCCGVGVCEANGMYENGLYQNGNQCTLYGYTMNNGYCVFDSACSACIYSCDNNNTCINNWYEYLINPITLISNTFYQTLATPSACDIFVFCFCNSICSRTLVFEYDEYNTCCGSHYNYETCVQYGCNYYCFSNGIPYAYIRYENQTCNGLTICSVSDCMSVDAPYSLSIFRNSLCQHAIITCY